MFQTVLRFPVLVQSAVAVCIFAWKSSRKRLALREAKERRTTSISRAKFSSNDKACNVFCTVPERRAMAKEIERDFAGKCLNPRMHTRDGICSIHRAPPQTRNTYQHGMVGVLWKQQGGQVTNAVVKQRRPARSPATNLRNQIDISVGHGGVGNALHEAAHSTNSAAIAGGGGLCRNHKGELPREVVAAGPPG